MTINNIVYRNNLIYTKLILFTCLTLIQSFATATIVQAGNMRLECGLSTFGNLASGTNCKARISWGFAAIDENAPVVSCEWKSSKLTIGGTEINLPANGRTNLTGETITYMSNHFANGTKIAIVAETIFVVNGSPITVSETKNVKVYNVAFLARGKDMYDKSKIFPAADALPIVESAVTAAKYDVIIADNEEFIKEDILINMANSTLIYMNTHGNSGLRISSNIQ